MYCKLMLVLGLALPVVVLPTATIAEPLPPSARWISQDAVIVLEVASPKALFDFALHPKLIDVITSLPDFQKQAAQADFQRLRAVVEYLEAALHTDWQTGLRTLTGGGVTLAVDADRTAVVMIDAEDGQMLQQLHDVAAGIGQRGAGKRGQSNRAATEQYQGATIATLGKGGFYALLGNRLLLSNKAEGLKTALDFRANRRNDSLAALPAYQAAQQAAGAGAAARLYVNMAMLNRYPPVQRGLEKTTNPWATLLSGSLTEALRRSTWLAIGLHVDQGTLRLEAAVDGRVADSSGAAAFASPKQPGDGALPNLSVPRGIAAFSFYRDLHGFYAAKDTLFPERTSALILFENMMGIFFSGRDLTEEVLSQAKPEIRLVVAGQQYDPAIGTPQVQLPAFAAVFRMRHPDEFMEVVEEAWQKALGLTNFTRGQKAQPGLIIDRQTHADTRFSVACFSVSGEKDKDALDVRFNYRPSLARVGEYLILSSSDGLTKDLIDALKKEMAEQPKSLVQTHTALELDGAAFASVLSSNRKNLVRQNMVEKGNTPEQAEKDVQFLTEAARYLDHLSLNIGAREDTTYASLKVKLNLP